jgi:hypothetical protein
MNSAIFNGLTCLLISGALVVFGVGAARRKRQLMTGESRTRAGVVMGHVYDPMGFRTLDYIVSDDGQNRPEIVVVNYTRDSNLLLIEGDDGLTVLEIGSESERHGDTAYLN